MINNMISQKYNNKKLILAVFFVLFILIFAIFSFYPIETALTIVAWLVLAGLIYKPEIGLYLMVFFLPVINWNFYYGRLEIPFIDLLSLVVLMAFILKQAYLFIFDRKNFKLKFPLFIVFILFFATAIISSFGSNIVNDSLWYNIRWILFFYLAYIVLPFNIISNKKILKNVLLGFSLAGLAVVLMGTASLYFQDWQNDFVRIKPLAIAGIFPLGDNQNLLAEVIIVSLFFSLALKYWFKAETAGKIINLIIIFSGLVLIGTFSRAAWLVLIFQTSVYLIYKKSLFKKIFLPGLLIILMLLPVFYYMFELQGQYRIGVSSTENRLMLTQISWQAFLDKPWFGRGSGNFVNLVADNTRFTAKYGAPLDSHGVLQKILAENGLFGILAFTLLAFNIIYIFWQALKNYKAEINLLLPLVCGSLGVFMFEFFNTSYYKGKLWLPIAVTLAAVNLAKNNQLYDAKN